MKAGSHRLDFVTVETSEDADGHSQRKNVGERHFPNMAWRISENEVLEYSKTSYTLTENREVCDILETDKDTTEYKGNRRGLYS